MDIYRPHHQPSATPGRAMSIGGIALKHVSTVSDVTVQPTSARLTQLLSDDSLSHSAKRAIQLRQYQWALKLLNQLILRHPEKAIYYNNRGLVHLWLGQPEAALADCNWAVLLDSNLDQAYNNRANCYAALGLATQAVNDYEMAIDLNPFNVRARINLGVMLRDLDELDEALVCFDEALIFHQLNILIYAERGRTYHLRGDWNCAIADYHRALNLIETSESISEHQRLTARIKAWLAELLPPDRG